ncbi:MAG: trypsin-like serine protease [Rhodospirillales bacterium]|nr:trypsin-like serine protease [Rhodospirillales bacterium]
MSRLTFSIVVGCAVAALWSPAWAQQPDASAGVYFSTGMDVPPPPPGKRPTFFTPTPTFGVKPLVTNGTEVTYGQWQATLLSTNNGCTATAVGPFAILTAAHCLKYGLSITIEVNGIERFATCEIATDYSADYDIKGKETDANWNKTSADYALCAIDDGGAGLKPDKFETINISPILATNQSVRLIGYGCDGGTILSQGGGTLRTATAVVHSLPTGNNNYIQLRAANAQNNAILCPGDSGGTAFWPVVIAGGSRRIVGVNSRTGVLSDKKTLSGTSFVSSMSSPAAVTFLTTWAKQHKVEVCGVTPSASNCRK